MPITIVRYTTRPEAAQTNADLISQVFAELAAQGRDDLRYAAFRLGDQEFLHLSLAQAQPSPLHGIAAFRRFREGVEQRCVEPPRSLSAVLVGQYRLPDLLR
ncbi:MAG TPA: hypothetical protein VIO33_13385 [Burkholderiaceae bacterium]